MEKILVVDDEPHMVRLLKNFLALKGYDVDTAENGLEAIEKVKTTHPQIVLLDIIMPGIGGMDTLKKIKEIDPAAIIIMISALIDEELAKRALELGAADYIGKPIDMSYLEAFLMIKSVDVRALNS